MPEVSVLMPVYNGGAFLRSAIESILSQSYSNFEFIIIDDGSTDDSVEIIKSFKDERIQLHKNGSNLGLIASLNYGLEHCKGKYIARMDCDDVSSKERLEKQVAHMNAHPETGLLGSGSQYSGRFKLYRRLPLNSAEIKSRLFIENIFIHPSMMIRKSVLTENKLQYNPAFPHAEDYALWLNLLQVTEFALLTDEHIFTRMHDNQVSVLYQQTQIDSVDRAHQLIFEKLKLNPSEKEKKIHRDIFFHRFDYSIGFLETAEKWFLQLKNANLQEKLFQQKDFESALSMMWFSMCTDFASRKIATWKIFRQSEFYQPDYYSRFYLFKFRLKSFM